MPHQRQKFRYQVDIEYAELTPLASIKAYYGEEALRVLNVSSGGLAILFERQKDFKEGDQLDLSLEIRERAFPVTVEIKACRGLRYSCQFLDLSPTLELALESFMAPKSIGESLELNEKLLNNDQALNLVDGAKYYRAYVGRDESVAFVWLGEEDQVKKLVFASKGRVLEWTEDHGLRTGEFLKKNSDEPVYHAAPDEMFKQYFVDVMTSWLSGDDGLRFTKELLNESSKILKFPQQLNLIK